MFQGRLPKSDFCWDVFCFIIGSSRMKGGSATAVLLDAICLRTLELSQASCGLTLLRPSDCSAGSSSASISSICLDYQSAHSKTYCSGSQNDALPSCMRQAAKSLRSGGRVLYVGAQSAGCMAFIDASEMPDTYGSPFDQIRGFVEGGWGENGVDNAEGDISHISGLHRISYDNFRTDLLPTLGESDTVVVTAHNGSLTPDTLALADDVKLKSKLVFLCVVNKESMTREAEGIFTSLKQISHCLTVINVSQEMEGISDYCLKLLLNALSTYAQAAGRGAVYKGLMVTTGPANDKIYNR
jgi:N-acetylmuramic acid 6-phosphate (MurNAc-6-P) etherase